MRSFPLEGEHAKPDSPIKKIISGASGIELTLSSAPTSQANGLLILPFHGDTGHFGNTLYKNLNGTIVKIAGTTI